MYDLTEKELLDNYNKLLQLVEEHFEGEVKKRYSRCMSTFKIIL